MAKFGSPTKFIAMVRQFHDGMLARVQNDGEFSDPFPVTNGVKQDCVLAPNKKRKDQGVPQSQTAALPRPQEEEETDKSKQAQTKQTYEKH